MTSPFTDERDRIEQALTFDTGCEPSAQEIIDALNRAGFQITPPAGEAEHIPNAEFCPHCYPCRNTWGMVEAQRLNEQYDECLRDLAAYVGAGGYNSADLIDPKIANEKVRWGIDHIVRVQQQAGKAEPWGWYDPATETIYKIPVDVYPSDAIPLYRTAPPSPVGPVWQPIETAPMTGQPILLAKIAPTKAAPEFKICARPPYVWWVCKGSWSHQYARWWDGIEPSGLAGPTHWYPMLKLPPDSPGAENPDE